MIQLQHENQLTKKPETYKAISMSASSEVLFRVKKGTPAWELREGYVLI